MVVLVICLVILLIIVGYIAIQSVNKRRKIAEIAKQASNRQRTLFDNISNGKLTLEIKNIISNSRGIGLHVYRIKIESHTIHIYFYSTDQLSIDDYTYCGEVGNTYRKEKFEPSYYIYKRDVKCYRSISDDELEVFIVVLVSYLEQSGSGTFKSSGSCDYGEGIIETIHELPWQKTTSNW